MIKVMKRVFYFLSAMLFVISCTNNAANNQTTEATETPVQAEVPETPYDASVGTGKYTEENFSVEPTVNTAMANKGNTIYSAKCQSCHKTSNERLVGPGFKGVTERRTPVWIMNFLTNTDEMIDVDPAMQDELEICMVRMPDQALSEEEAHAMVEFFRNNDK